MKILSDLISFFKSRWFLINLSIAAIVVVGGVYAIMAYLADYTKHEITHTVPNFSGYKINELDEVFQENKLRYKIIDSIYDAEREKGVVIEQLPEPGAMVKENRNIYLTINATLPPMVKMPNLINMSKRQSLSVLDIVGLKVKSFEYKPDICTDCVLKQKYDGKEIEPGVQIYKGERVTLVLGEGRGTKDIDMPYLIESTFEEAKNLLQNNALEVGVSIYEDCKTAEDSLKAKVFRQIPEYIPKRRIKPGSEVDIWLSIDSTKFSM